MRSHPGALGVALLVGVVGLASSACREHIVFDAKSREAGRRRGDRTPWDERNFTCEEDPDAPLAPRPEWEGVSMDRAFHPSQTGRLRLQMPESTKDEGWIVFGDWSALPAPTQGEACYPKCAFAAALKGGVPVPLEGFQYPARLTASETRGHQRLDFKIHAPWEAWCEQQTPIPFGQTHVCAPQDTLTVDDEGHCVDANGNEGSAQDCCREILCNRVQVCRCDADGCRASDAVKHLEVILFPGKDQMIAELDNGGLFLLDPIAPLGDGGAGVSEAGPNLQ